MQTQSSLSHIPCHLYSCLRNSSFLIFFPNVATSGTFIHFSPLPLNLCRFFLSFLPLLLVHYEPSSVITEKREHLASDSTKNPLAEWRNISYYRQFSEASNFQQKISGSALLAVIDLNVLLFRPCCKEGVWWWIGESSALDIHLHLLPPTCAHWHLLTPTRTHFSPTRTHLHPLPPTYTHSHPQTSTQTHTHLISHILTLFSTIHTAMHHTHIIHFQHHTFILTSIFKVIVGSIRTNEHNNWIGDPWCSHHCSA